MCERAYDRPMRTDTASRVIAAPPGRVYAARTDPDALATWLPPQGMRGRFERFDLRPGGSYRLVLTYDDSVGCARQGDGGLRRRRRPGSSTSCPDERVVQAVDFESDDSPPSRAR